MSDENTLTGLEYIKASLKDMPTKPGVYRMLDAQSDVLYVGKAKNLKNRVSNYASASGLSNRIIRMVSQTTKLEIITTGSEAEALLLEANLIKKLKPRYNILLRDDKSFPYLFVQTQHEFPRIRKHRGAQKEKGEYYGPFASVGALNQTIAILQKAFLLRPCSDSIFNNRSRPCLQYQIKRCSAPCVDYISKHDYAESLSHAQNFLKGKTRDVQEHFAEQMQAHSDAMEYEKAAALRDRIKALTKVQQEQQLRTSGLEDADVIALHRGNNQSCVQVFFFRAGNHFGNQPYFPRHTEDASEADILSAFIGQFYQTHTPPKEILISHDLEEQNVINDALSLNVSYKVQLKKPARGDKLDLIKQVSKNAKAALERKLNEQLSELRHLENLAKLFALSETPERVEVYDNSHISGTHAVGAMIVAGTEGLMKNHYRRFNIKDSELTPGDDYGMMREVFTRRFKRLQKEDPDRSKGIWPGLVLIDGGAGQVSAVKGIMEELGIDDIPFIGVAKGPERNAGRENFFIPDKQPFMLEPNDPTLHYIQRLRDEAHRFAIGSHRIKRAKAIGQSGLDDIPGVGAARKRALLHHFGSRKEVERATLAELENVPSISKQLAKVIYQYFH
ncbi:MAG: excinuclease ABC subunit UvrC [Rickettsiales bacterium]|nr:excinuclease ABC subunit UvrC [Rickettsiales bacterium]